MIRDTGLVFGYELRRTLRSPVWAIFGIIQPFLWLTLFAPLLPHVPLEYFAAGILVINMIFGSVAGGYDLVASAQAGVVERLAVSPANRTALMLGRLIRDALIMSIQGLLLLGMAWVMGMRIPIPGLVIGLALAALAGLGGAAAVYSVALQTRDHNALAAVVNFFMLPLMLLSGALIPLGVGPGWLETIGHANPFYYVAEAGRDLFAGRYGEPSVPIAFAITVALAVLTLTWATRSMRRAAA